MWERPADLPKLLNPPLDEIVIGVQFRLRGEAPEFLNAEVWKQLAADYPVVHAHPPIDPKFEGEQIDFEAQQLRLQQVRFPVLQRHWFIGRDENKLVQFQPDRVLFNWRRLGVRDNQYSFFEEPAKEFFRVFTKINEYFSDCGIGPADINQAEVSYINFIEEKSYLGSSMFPLRILHKAIESEESFRYSFTKKMISEKGSFIGRTYHDLATAVQQNSGKQGLKVDITCRGYPEGNSLDSAMEFLFAARRSIVNSFFELMSDGMLEKFNSDSSGNANA